MELSFCIMIGWLTYLVTMFSQFVPSRRFDFPVGLLATFHGHIKTLILTSCIQQILLVLIQLWVRKCKWINIKFMNNFRKNESINMFLLITVWSTYMVFICHRLLIFMWKKIDSKTKSDLNKITWLLCGRARTLSPYSFLFCFSIILCSLTIEYFYYLRELPI